MTLTAPGRAAAQSLPGEVVNKLKQLPGITGAHVDIVWDPRGQRPDVGCRETATRDVLTVSPADIARPYARKSGVSILLFSFLQAEFPLKLTMPAGPLLI